MATARASGELHKGKRFAVYVKGGREKGFPTEGRGRPVDPNVMIANLMMQREWLSWAIGGRKGKSPLPQRKEVVNPEDQFTRHGEPEGQWPRGRLVLGHFNSPLKKTRVFEYVPVLGFLVDHSEAPIYTKWGKERNWSVRGIEEMKRKRKRVGEDLEKWINYRNRKLDEQVH